MASTEIKLFRELKMKFVSYQKKDEDRVGILYEKKVYDLQKSASLLRIKLPSTMKKFLEGETSFMKLAENVFRSHKKG